MRRARIMRAVLGITLAGSSLGSIGCTHNYYYGTAPACAPAAPAVVTNGAVCQLAPQGTVPGTVVSQVPSRSTIVSGAPIYSSTTPPRVVVSEPTGGRKFGWKRSDPETGLATTRVEGAYDDDTTNR